MENNIELIKNILEVFFKNCKVEDFNIDINSYNSNEKLIINVSLPTTASIFIGKYGSNLEAFEIVLNNVANLNNQTDTRCRVEFDINGYRLNRQKESKIRLLLFMKSPQVQKRLSWKNLITGGMALMI